MERGYRGYTPQVRSYQRRNDARLTAGKDDRPFFRRPEGCRAAGRPRRCQGGGDGLVKVLVVTSEPISGDHLRSALGPRQTDDAEVMVIAPALHKSALRFWVSDADEAIAKAGEVQQKSAEQLRREGVSVDVNDTAEGDLTEAIRDALVTFPADRILLFVHPPEHERYREHADPEALSDEVGLPVEQFEVGAGASQNGNRP